VLRIEGGLPNADQAPAADHPKPADSEPAERGPKPSSE
jgi:hypothetical protein